jgi:hypothetical protein
MAKTARKWQNGTDSYSLVQVQNLHDPAGEGVTKNEVVKPLTLKYRAGESDFPARRDGKRKTSFFLKNSTRQISTNSTKNRLDLFGPQAHNTRLFTI